MNALRTLKWDLNVDRDAMPYPLTGEWLLANGGEQIDIDALRQSAHKDACLGPLKNLRKHSPVQAIVPLSDGAHILWVNKERKGYPYPASKAILDLTAKMGRMKITLFPSPYAAAACSPC